MECGQRGRLEEEIALAEDMSLDELMSDSGIFYEELEGTEGEA